MIDFCGVKRVALWAVSEDSDPNTAPEWVPKWAKAMAFEGNWKGIDEVADWVISLRK